MLAEIFPSTRSFVVHPRVDTHQSNQNTTTLKRTPVSPSLSSTASSQRRGKLSKESILQKSRGEGKATITRCCPENCEMRYNIVPRCAAVVVVGPATQAYLSPGVRASRSERGPTSGSERGTASRPGAGRDPLQRGRGPRESATTSGLQSRRIFCEALTPWISKHSAPRNILRKNLAVNCRKSVVSRLRGEQDGVSMILLSTWDLGCFHPMIVRTGCRQMTGKPNHFVQFLDVRFAGLSHLMPVHDDDGTKYTYERDYSVLR